MSSKINNKIIRPHAISPGPTRPGRERTRTAGGATVGADGGAGVHAPMVTTARAASKTPRVRPGGSAGNVWERPAARFPGPARPAR